MIYLTLQLHTCQQPFDHNDSIIGVNINYTSQDTFAIFIMVINNDYFY